MRMFLTLKPAPMYITDKNRASEVMATTSSSVTHRSITAVAMRADTGGTTTATAAAVETMTATLTVAGLITTCI